MDLKTIWIKALMFAIHERAPDDVAYLPALNQIDIVLADDIPTAAATFDTSSLRYQVKFGKKFLEELSQKPNPVRIVRAIIKHELDHIISGHLLMLNKEITVTKERLASLGFHVDKDVTIVLNDPTVFELYNIAKDSLVNLRHQELLESFATVPAEEILLGDSTDVIPAGTNLFNTTNYTSEDLLAALYSMLEQNDSNNGKNNNSNGGNKQNGGLLGGDIKPIIRKDVLDAAKEVLKDIRSKIDQQKLKDFEQLNVDIQYILQEKNKIDWTKYIRGLVGNIILEELKVNKHRFDKRYNFPPKLEREKVASILVLIDSSGSISDKILISFLSELFALKSKAVQITAYGYSIGVYPIKAAKQVTIHERGGTDLKNAIAQIKQKSKQAFLCDLLIIMTDGYDEFPHRELDTIRAKKIFIFPKDHDTFFEQQARKKGRVIVMPE